MYQSSVINVKKKHQSVKHILNNNISITCINRTLSSMKIFAKHNIICFCTKNADKCLFNYFVMHFATSTCSGHVSKLRKMEYSIQWKAKEVESPMNVEQRKNMLYIHINICDLQPKTKLWRRYCAQVYQVHQCRNRQFIVVCLCCVSGGINGWNNTGGINKFTMNCIRRFRESMEKVKSNM